MPSIIYYLRLYYLNRFDPIINKRYYRFVISINICLMMLIAFNKTISIIAFTLSDPISEINNPQSGAPYILRSISTTFHVIFVPAIGFLFLGRAYLLYFDMKWMKASNKGEWASLISGDDYSEKHSNIFIKYKNTLGNETYIYLRILLPICLIISCMLIIISFVHTFLDKTTCLTLIYLILVILLLSIYNKIPKHSKDLFLIKKELKIELLCGAVIILLNVVFVLFGSVIFDGMSVYFFICPMEFLFTLMFWLLALFSTRWVMIDSNLVLERSVMDMNISLIEMLKNKVAMELFINHLFSEFSSESMLCIIECLQWKYFIKSSCEKPLVLNKSLANVTLPNIANMKEFPQSAIVFNSALEF